MNEKRILSQKLILEALKKYRGLFNKAPDDQSLELYAEMLSESFEFKQVTWALSQLIKKGSPFFPSCGEIFAQLKPATASKEDLAPQVVAEMLQLIRMHGQYDEVRMLERASENARLAFLALGPTDDIRNSDPSIARAQLERLVKGVISSKEQGARNKELEAIGIDTSNVISIEGKAPMRKIGFAWFGDSPEGA